MSIHTTASICPQCSSQVSAELFEVGGTVHMVKTCENHGDFDTLYWGDVQHYEWLMQYRVEASRRGGADRSIECATYCSLCGKQDVETVLALIDVTNDCDLCCPICISDSGECDHHYYPRRDQIRYMLRSLRQTTRSTIGPTIAFTGGEPTLRDDLPELVRMAYEEGFSRTEVITNGIRIARDLPYVTALRQAGLSQLGLQFDGMDDQVYLRLRNTPLLETKLRAIENLEAVGQPTILAMCLAKGVNDHQLGAILQFAVDHKIIVEHVNVQMVAFSGRARQLGLGHDVRITPYEFAKLVEEQSGGRIKAADFYPPGFVAPLPEFIEAFTGKPQVKFFVHPCCDLATYLLIGKNGEINSLNGLLNVPGLLKALDRGRQEILARKGLSRWIYKALAPFTILRTLGKEIYSPTFRQMLFAGLGNRGYDPLSGLKDVLMVTCADYMDAWNFDVEKARTCTMHYLLPDGRRIPFCCYNVLHRGIMERQFSETPSVQDA